jgi:hypothetical protein
VAQLAREVALDKLTPGSPDDKFRVAVNTRIGAIPNIDRELGVELRDPEVKKFELESSTARVRGLRRLLDELVLGPVRIVRDYLNAMTYIGPLREIPVRSFRPRLSPDESRWARGLAAWDLLYTDASGVLLDEVNSWLAGEQRLRTGYRLEKFQFKEVPVPSRFHLLFDRGLSDDDLAEIQELYATFGGRSDIGLLDIDKNITVAPSDVGVGISQMIPVIVACLRDHQGILAIEQPELHVHPAIQVGLGDLFIHAVQARESRFGVGKTLLVETHSEHIMLRLLRRIRETSEGEVPPGASKLSPNDVAAIYVESDVDGVSFRPLRLSSDGDFIDRWPAVFPTSPSTAKSSCGYRKRRPKSRHNRRHERTRAAITIAIAVKINRRSLNFRARQQCLRPQLSPATTFVRGAFLMTTGRRSSSGLTGRVACASPRTQPCRSRSWQSAHQEYRSRRGRGRGRRNRGTHHDHGGSHGHKTDSHESPSALATRR